MNKRGEHKGKWYAEVYESERYVGTRTISVHVFDTEKAMEDFILDFNTKHLTDGPTPAIYRLAEWASWYTIHDYLHGVKYD